MKTKVAIAVSAVLSSTLVNAEVTVGESFVAAQHIKPLTQKMTQSVNPVNTIFTPEKALASGKYRYFVRLNDSPVALYKGGVAGFKATNPLASKAKGGKLRVKDKHVKAYKNYLVERQSDVITKAKSAIGKLDIKQQTTLAYNGFVVEMTQAEAVELAKVSGIANIQREILRYPSTDVGPQYIKADKIWEGAATGTASKGEGLIVGIIDTGINTDNPAFADVGGDGYDHTNPWGEGVYSGDCATEEWASLCNDKLIGVHSYSTLTDMYDRHDPDIAKNGEDRNGHGSHVAGTTAGNVLMDVDVEDGLVFEQISGVAPHANIISYQVCLPGENDAVGFAGCFGSLTVLAVEHAIARGVDVLNYSVGGGSSNPWNDPDALAFLAARQAGIHVATAASNEGPAAGTVGSPADAPWITSVAASTHNRDIERVVTINEQDFLYSASTGPSFSETIEAPLVYAATVDEANVEGCAEFAANAFENSIALISRGTCGFIDKVTNATTAGAKAVIVHNNREGDARLAMANLETTTIPSILVSENSGTAIVEALTADASLTASIAASPKVVEIEGSTLADFSSRGANISVPDVIVPSITAPGVNIFAPYADAQSPAFKAAPNPADFSFISGTSMASPHIAGALTLLADIQPNWSPAAAQSALMLTAHQNVLSHDGTDATVFDMGSGMADINLAVQTGLILEENHGGYISANPDFGGKPSAINLATMGNGSCVDTCTWTRTLTATQPANWSVAVESISEGVNISVSPESFSLTSGQTQEITVTADVSDAGADWNFANIALTAEGMPDARMPIAVRAGGDNLPQRFDLIAGRNSGSLLLPSFQSKDIKNASVVVYDKISALVEPRELSVMAGGFEGFPITFDENVHNVTFATTASTAPDVDLRILDANFNNIGVSAGPTQFESVTLLDLPAGTYHVVVDGFTASTPGGSDAVTVEVTSVVFNEASISEKVSINVAEKDSGFDLNVMWNNVERSIGYVELSSEDGKSKLLPFSLVYEDDLATVVSSDIEAQQQLKPGVAQRVSFDIEPNFESVDKVYNITATTSEEFEFNNISNNGEASGGTVFWAVERKAGESDEMLSVSFDLIARKSGDNFTLTLTDELNGDKDEISYQFSVPEVAPVAVVNYASFVKKDDLVRLDASGSSDANGDALSYEWTQRSGKPVTLASSSSVVSFVAPSGGGDGEVMTFDLIVTDANGNTDEAAVSFTITQNKGGGAMGYWLLILLPLLGLRRRV